MTKLWMLLIALPSSALLCACRISYIVEGVDFLTLKNLFIKNIMVNLINWFVSVSATYASFRLVYEYYWQPFKIWKVVKNKSRQIDSLTPLHIHVTKMMKLRTYYIGQLEKPQDLKTVLARKVFFKYEGDEAWIYSNNLLNYWERSEIKDVLANPIHDQIKHLLTLNKFQMKKKDSYYDLIYDLTDDGLSHCVTLKIAPKDKNKLFEPIQQVPFSYLTDKKRNFLVFVKEGGKVCNRLIVLQQEKEKPQFSYSPMQPALLFLSPNTFEQMLKNKKFFEIWQVQQHSPLYHPIKSVTFESGDKVTLGLEQSLNNKTRAYRTLKWGQLYYNFTCMNI